MTTVTPKPKKDFWAPFRTDLKTFVGLTRKASVAGLSLGTGAVGTLLSSELTTAATSHTSFDLAANLGGLALAFVGGFIGGFAAGYATSNAS
jgi:hypothetical protein